jgi:hypothetical protein
METPSQMKNVGVPTARAASGRTSLSDWIEVNFDPGDVG